MSHDLEHLGESRPAGRPQRVLSQLERRTLSALGATGLSATMAAARLNMAHRTLSAIFQRDEDALVAWGIGRAVAGERLLKILWQLAEGGSAQAAGSLARILNMEGGEDEDGGPRAAVAIQFQIVSSDGTARPLRHVNAEDSGDE